MTMYVNILASRGAKKVRPMVNDVITESFEKTFMNRCSFNYRNVSYVYRNTFRCRTLVNLVMYGLMNLVAKVIRARPWDRMEISVSSGKSRLITDYITIESIGSRICLGSNPVLSTLNVIKITRTFLCSRSFHLLGKSIRFF